MRKLALVFLTELLVETAVFSLKMLVPDTVPNWVWWLTAAVCFVSVPIPFYLSEIRPRRGDAPTKQHTVEPYKPEPLPKVYTRWTASEIIEAARDQTSMQAAGIIQSHLGKWLKVHDTVHDVVEGEQYILVFLGEGIDLTISLDFEKERWRVELETLRQGDRLAAEGRITEIEPKARTIQLDDCKIVEIEAKGRNPEEVAHDGFSLRS